MSSQQGRVDSEYAAYLGRAVDEEHRLLVSVKRRWHSSPFALWSACVLILLCVWFLGIGGEDIKSTYIVVVVLFSLSIPLVSDYLQTRKRLDDLVKLLASKGLLERGP